MKSPGKILLFRQSSLGDVLLTLPVVQTLYEKFPNTVIDYITKPAYASILDAYPAINETIIFNNNSTFLKVVKNLRSRRYNLFIDLQANFRSNIIRAAIFPARALKYRKRRFAREMVVHRSQLKLKVDHTLNAYFHPLRRLGIEGSPSPPELTIPPEIMQSSDAFLKDFLPVDCKKIIALCPGARHYEKRWPYENFCMVAELLLEDQTVGIMVISSSDDNVPASLELDHPRLAPVRDFGILAVAAILSRCDVALTNDSGIMHLANAAGTRVVALFGPTNPRLGFSPTLPGSRVICDDVFCSPCSVHGRKSCYQPVKYCLEKITPDRVFSEILKMI